MCRVPRPHVPHTLLLVAQVLPSQDYLHKWLPQADTAEMQPDLKTDYLLVSAVLYNHPDRVRLVQKLLAKGAPLEATCVERGQSVLHKAVACCSDTQVGQEDTSHIWHGLRLFCDASLNIKACWSVAQCLLGYK